MAGRSKSRRGSSFDKLVNFRPEGFSDKPNAYSHDLKAFGMMYCAMFNS